MAYNFKKEEDVKQFLENLRMEYHFGCYGEKNPEVCHLLGDYFDNIESDFTKAAQVYRSNCNDYKYPRSCYRFGVYSLVGKGKLKQCFQTAYDYFEKGCNVDSADSCLHQGLMHIQESPEKVIKIDPQKGLDLLAKSCMLKNANACFYACGYYLSGILKPEIRALDLEKHKDENSYAVKKDFKKAHTYALEGCNMRNVQCCVNLSQMYKRGDGVEKNEELYKSYRKIAEELYGEMDSTTSLKFGQGLSDT